MRSVKNKKNKEKSKSAVLYSKRLILIFSVILFFLVSAVIQQWLSYQKVKGEIETLTFESEILQKKNKELQQSIAYYSSQEYIELEAKRNLGLVKSGEEVVVIANDDIERFLKEVYIADGDESSVLQEMNGEIQQESGLLLWYNYFFNN